LRLDPPSKPFGPENVISGVARPEKWTNIWISDPNEKFPQRLILEFEEKVEFNTVYLTFDTFLHLDTHYWPPLYKAPECVRDYALKVLDIGDVSIASIWSKPTDLCWRSTPQTETQQPEYTKSEYTKNKSNLFLIFYWRKGVLGGYHDGDPRRTKGIRRDAAAF